MLGRFKHSGHIATEVAEIYVRLEIAHAPQHPQKNVHVNRLSFEAEPLSLMFFLRRSESDQIGDARIDPPDGIRKRNRLMNANPVAHANGNHPRSAIALAVECEDQGLLEWRKKECTCRMAGMMVQGDQLSRVAQPLPQCAKSGPLPGKAPEFLTFLIGRRNRRKRRQARTRHRPSRPTAGCLAGNRDHVQIIPGDASLAQAELNRRLRNSASHRRLQFRVLDGSID